MSLYVEVMCDVLDETPIPGNYIDHRCWTNSGSNPSGSTVASARKEARRLKWKLRGGWACCPGCLETPAGQAALRSTP